MKRVKVSEVILTLLGTAAFAAIIFVILVEWLSGCGESWVQADGTRVMGECVFIGGGK
jgi:uncharacterized membrane protein (DUF441 family)